MSEARTLMLLPGLDGTGIFFRPLLRALPASVRPRVIAFPSRGRNDYEHLLDVASAAVADIGEFWVLGWSFSGPLALMLAERYPERVRGVILCATFIRPPRPGMAWLRFAVRGPTMWLFRVARRTPAFLFRYWPDDLRRDKVESWKSISAWSLAPRARAVLSLDARELLRACKAPVSYLGASQDSVVPAANMAEIMRERPSVRAVIIEGPHLALYTNPEEAAQAITQLMDE